MASLITGNRRARASPSTERIFINYRRADSGGWARSLHDQLEERLGAGRVFRDVEMQSGVDFHQHVEALLDRCDVLLAVIGKSWTSMLDAEGNRRLDNRDDLVRSEIARALQREDVHVIPVLVDGARMPAERELPPDLAPLSRRHAAELSDSRWAHDVEGLAQRLRELLGEKPPGRPWRHWLLRAGVVIATLAGALLLWLSVKPQGANTPSSTDARLLSATRQPRIQSLGEWVRDARLKNAPRYTADQRRELGLVFDVRVSIEGRLGQKLPLSWTMYDASTARPLPGDTYNQPAATFTPEATRHTRTWPVWVPYPPTAGRYFVHFVLKGPDGRTEDERDTAKFRYPMPR